MKIAIRDLFWLTLIAAVALAWWLDRSREIAKHEEFRARIKLVMDANGLGAGCGLGCSAGIANGYVLAVNSTDLVEVSLGADDGLKPGHTLQVFSGDQYHGQITIRTVGPDRAVGQIDKKFDRGKIQKGDNVTSKLGA